jgi:P27 family predicted phage terminase small subunit
MGQRGPKPLPSAVKLARGTFRPDRAAHHEAAAIGKPNCPAWMKDKDARSEFRRLVRVLGEMGLIGAADGNLLVRYCTAWVRWRRINQTLLANPGAEVATYKDEAGKPKSIQVSALHSIERSLADQLSRMEGLLGMSPSARSRIEVAPQSAPADAPKSRFFNPPMRMAQ